MTSAAVIMVAVFSIFATLSVIEFKMFGVGMASAVPAQPAGSALAGGG